VGKGKGKEVNTYDMRRGNAGTPYHAGGWFKSAQPGREEGISAGGGGEAREGARSALHQKRTGEELGGNQNGRNMREERRGKCAD